MKRVSMYPADSFFLLWILDVNHMEISEVCMHIFYQAEKLRSPSLSKELCILAVIEILYLWKALSNCSTAKLQTMTQGTKIFHIDHAWWCHTWINDYFKRVFVCKFAALFVVM